MHTTVVGVVADVFVHVTVVVVVAAVFTHVTVVGVVVGLLQHASKRVIRVGGVIAPINNYNTMLCRTNTMDCNTLTNKTYFI